MIYTGLRQSPEQIVAAAAQEDADVIGLSILSGAHLPICRRVVELLRERGMDSCACSWAGSSRAQDIAELQAAGRRRRLPARSLDRGRDAGDPEPGPQRLTPGSRPCR